MALTLAQKSSIRRHLKYPAIGLLSVQPGGASLASASAGWRYFEAYGFLEYKMNNLNPDEEARAVGHALGAAALVGPQPNPGDTVSLTLSGGPLGSPVTISATAPAAVAGIDARLTLCNLLAQQVGQSSALQAAGFYSATPFGTGPFAQNAIPLPEIALVNPSSFTISGSGSGVLVPQITATGALLPPSSSLDGVTIVYGYLPILDGLEAAHASASQNLDTLKADVWQGRANEIGQRTSLYEMWVQKFSDFLGVKINPLQPAANNPRRSGAMQFV